MLLVALHSSSALLKAKRVTISSSSLVMLNVFESSVPSQALPPAGLYTHARDDYSGNVAAVIALACILLSILCCVIFGRAPEWRPTMPWRRYMHPDRSARLYEQDPVVENNITCWASLRTNIYVCRWHELIYIHQIASGIINIRT